MDIIINLRERTNISVYTLTERILAAGISPTQAMDKLHDELAAVGSQAARLAIRAGIAERIRDLSSFSQADWQNWLADRKPLNE